MGCAVMMDYVSNLRNAPSLTRNVSNHAPKCPPLCTRKNASIWRKHTSIPHTISLHPLGVQHWLWTHAARKREDMNFVLKSSVVSLSVIHMFHFSEMSLASVPLVKRCQARAFVEQLSSFFRAAAWGMREALSTYLIPLLTDDCDHLVVVQLRVYYGCGCSALHFANNGPYAFSFTQTHEITDSRQSGEIDMSTSRAY